VAAYRPGFGEAHFEALLAIVEAQAADGPFTAYDVLYAALGTGATEDLCDVETILADLADLGVLRRDPGGQGLPPVWSRLAP